MSDVLVFAEIGATLVLSPGPVSDLIVFDPLVPDFIVIDPNAPDVMVIDPVVPDMVVITSSGPAGVAGTMGSVYVHTQSTPSASWIVVHGLNRRYLNISVYVNEQLGLADVDIIDANSLAVIFPVPTSGVAALS